MSYKEEVLKNLNALVDELYEFEKSLFKNKMSWCILQEDNVTNGGAITFPGIPILKCREWELFTAHMYDVAKALQTELYKLDRTYRFKKKQVMAYVCAHNGPLTNEEILLQTSLVEMKEHHPSSNYGYFPGVAKDGTLVKCGTKHRKSLFMPDALGLVYAEEIEKKIGTVPAQRANLVSKSYFESRKP